MSELPTPVWIRVDSWEWYVTTVQAGGIEMTRRVRKTRFTDRGRLHWYVLEDGHEPWELATTIIDAQDEFLLAFHGWRRPYGYADGDGTRPIYAKNGRRRERAFVLAELTRRRICRSCRRPHALNTDQTVHAHNTPRGLNRCPGTHEPPAIEPAHPSVDEWTRETAATPAAKP